MHPSLSVHVCVRVYVYVRVRLCPQVSHGNTARHALEYGDETLAKICGLIASDEGRHEMAYTKIIDGVFERDPDGAVLAFADMMRKQIVMPAHLMSDGGEHEKTNNRNLFAVRTYVCVCACVRQCRFTCRLLGVAVSMCAQEWVE